ncbi:MAG: triple tyrosine motif-containing protein [Chitinophagaceae bacterium]
MRKLSLCLLVCLPAILNGQNTIGFPEIINYTKQQFNGGNQTWDIQMDEKGIVYCANNDGLLTFNGKYWKLYPIPNGTRMRSVQIDKDGKIYVGAQDELGYFFPDDQGQLKYTSLKPLIPLKERQFADIWNIVLYDGSVFFRAFNKIFQLKDGTIRTYNATEEWRFLCKTSKGLYAQEMKGGLLKFNNDSWEPACKEFADRNMLVTSILYERNDTLLVTTLKNGIFYLHNHKLIPKPTEADNVFFNSRIYSANILQDDQLAIGTTSEGCYILNKEGRIIQVFSVQEGLQNSNVLKIFSDSDQNLWLALDNGIDLIRYNTAVKHIYPDKKNLFSSYAIRIFNGRLYVGTSDGLYNASLNNAEHDLSFVKSNFAFVSGTKGQVWNLSEINQRLLMGHHEGTFEVQGAAARPVLEGIGSWLYAPLSSINPSPSILMGSYNGLRVLHFANNNFTTAKHLQGLFESLRFMAIDNDNVIWCSHPYRGVYKITLKGDTAVDWKLYTQANGLPSDLNNSVFRIKSRMVVATDSGLYEYDDTTDKFRHSSLHDILGAVPIKYVTEDNSGNIWFVSNKKAGIIDFQKPANNKPYSIIYFSELNGKMVGGFECIYPYNSENVFVGAEKGIYHINYKKYIRSGHALTVLIGEVKATGDGGKDSLVFGGYFAGNSKMLAEQDQKNAVRLSDAYNNFHFEFASTSYEQENNIEFSYQLQGFDRTWSEWTQKTEKEYTNLPPGHYTFIVKARNNLGIESAPVKYSFEILPPWYQSIPAICIYVLLLTGCIVYLMRRQKEKFIAQKIKHEKEQEKLRYLHQLEIDRNEKELIKLQNEKLETEVQFKNKELASATMHLVERGKVLARIKEELVQSVKKLESPTNTAQFKRVMRLLDEAENNEEDWEHFSTHFDQVHNNFLDTLKNKFPQLTNTDLKLCAYLRMNLTSKEIAQLMNISVRGVEISRYRLRKKLNLTGDVTLFDFLLQQGEQDAKRGTLNTNTGAER